MLEVLASERSCVDRSASACSLGTSQRGNYGVIMPESGDRDRAEGAHMDVMNKTGGWHYSGASRHWDERLRLTAVPIYFPATYSSSAEKTGAEKMWTYRDRTGRFGWGLR